MFWERGSSVPNDGPHKTEIVIDLDTWAADAATTNSAPDQRACHFRSHGSARTAKRSMAHTVRPFDSHDAIVAAVPIFLS